MEVSAQKTAGLVLIVDDSPTEVHVFKSAMERHGFTTECAQNGADGVAMARRLKPDLILMDVIMPGVNGFQATRQLSRDPETRDIPIIMVTTKSDETDRIWGQRQGAVDYIVKPVDEKDLITRIRAVIGGNVGQTPGEAVTPDE